MKLFIVSLLTAVIIFLQFGCKENIASPIPVGAFEYTAYDSIGTMAAKGWFKLIIHDSSNVAGEWHINQLDSAARIGPQIGNGFLKGSFYQGMLVVELNPDFVDNNVSLAGKLQGNKYSGKWSWSTFIGLTNWGTFEALRKAD